MIDMANAETRTAIAQNILRPKNICQFKRHNIRQRNLVNPNLYMEMLNFAIVKYILLKTRKNAIQIMNKMIAIHVNIDSKDGRKLILLKTIKKP